MDINNGCMPSTETMRMPQLAMLYSPIQEYRALYGKDEALRRGTLFSELDKPLLEDCK